MGFWPVLVGILCSYDCLHVLSKVWEKQGFEGPSQGVFVNNTLKTGTDVAHHFTFLSVQLFTGMESEADQIVY